MNKLTSFLFCLVLAFGLVGTVNAAVNSVTPSTNEINETNGWAYVDQLSKTVGSTDLQFISTRPFWSCFEYRIDGDTSQVLSENGGVNYNINVTDGLYPYVCENNSNETLTIHAKQYVEVRMVFGAEADERFDWTRFDVIPKLAPGNSKPGLDRYMNNPGRQQATEVGAQCGSGAGSGAFGYFGKGLNMAGGADGYQTGLNNSGVCGNRQSDL